VAFGGFLVKSVAPADRTIHIPLAASLPRTKQDSLRKNQRVRPHFYEIKEELTKVRYYGASREQGRNILQGWSFVVVVVQSEEQFACSSLRKPESLSHCPQPSNEWMN